ncbi:MAG: OadG family protein [Candidatus Kapaibacterium sp.]
MTDNIIQSLVILFVGVLGVFSSLAFFSFLIWLMKKSDKLFTLKILTKKEEAPAPIRQSRPAAKEEDDTQLIAVLTAAAMEIIRKPVRIRHIQYLHDQHTGGSWAVSGRSTVMASHNLTKRTR